MQVISIESSQKSTVSRRTPQASCRKSVAFCRGLGGAGQRVQTEACAAIRSAGPAVHRVARAQGCVEMPRELRYAREPLVKAYQQQKEEWVRSGLVFVFIFNSYFKIVVAKVLFYWSRVDLQCCVNYCCTAKWLSYTHTHSSSYSFPLWFIIGYWV